MDAVGLVDIRIDLGAPGFEELGVGFGVGTAVVLGEALEGGGGGWVGGVHLKLFKMQSRRSNLRRPRDCL